MDKRYSVLMSVYGREKSEYLQAALMSILNQTVLPYEIVLVCDGPLTDELEQVLESFQEYLTLVRLKKNEGLGRALSEGLQYCSCEWVVRMDSDDIAVRNRCEKQLEYVQQHPEVDVLSGTLAEFEGNALTAEEAQQHILSYKTLPVTDQEIGAYIKYRNPMNHPCVMFRKSKVLQAGGYEPCDLFEDYDLWVRMYLRHCNFANLTDTILYMRINNMHKRRGGIRYAKAIIHFWNQMYRRRVITLPQYCCTIILRVAVSLLPNQIRKIIYDKKLRNY